MAAKPTATGSLSINEGAGPFHYGDTLTFTYANDKVGGAHPMIELALFQDVDADGTVETGLFDGDLVWVQLNTPERSFLVGNDNGQLDMTKSAKGKARLLMYGWKGRQEFIIPLASVDFDVEA